MSPLKPIHQTMSLEEFHDFPRRLGWKHEYYGGKIHVTPAETAVVTLRLTLAPRPADAADPVRTVTSDDCAKLIALFELAFCNAVEYAELTAAGFRAQAEKSMCAFLAAAEQPWLAASCLWKEDHRCLGAAFIKPYRHGPILEPLMVRTSHQRRGLATRLMNHVVNKLLQMGATHLYSHCHLSNAGSLAWHERFGFEVLPDEWIASHRAFYYREELKRRERLKDLTDEHRAELKRQANIWEAERQRLEDLSRTDFAAAHPMVS